jgi:DNA-binding IclR family transcriptional regulator
MQERPRNYSKSANRALDVMSYLASIRQPARSADIADALGIARSSTNQLLKTMVLDGYLVLSTNTKTYFPSLRMAPLGHWLAQCYPSLDRYRAIINDIHGQTGAIVTLSMQNDCLMQLMTTKTSDPAQDPLLTTGGTVPVVGSAIGSAILTTQSRSAVARLVERAQQHHLVGRGVPCDSSFLDDVRLFRMKGYASAPSSVVIQGGDGPRSIDYWCIAMTLPGEERVPEVVLGFAGPMRGTRGKEWDLVNLMRRSIRQNLN